MLERGVEEELLDYCSTNNIRVIVYSPMQKGLLTGKFTRERVQNLAEDDHRREDRHFQEPEFVANITLVEGLRSLAGKSGRTIAQLAIAWVLRRSEVTAAIVGARHPSQIKETVAAGEWELSNGDIAAIDKLLQERQKVLNLS